MLALDELLDGVSDEAVVRLIVVTDSIGRPDSLGGNHSAMGHAYRAMSVPPLVDAR